MKILITDGETRAALAATRSLSKNGYEVIVTGSRKLNISSVSKYCKKSFGGVSPACDSSGSFRKIREIVASECVDIVLPITEAAAVTLAKNEIALGKDVILASPPIEVISKLYSKYDIFVLAEKKGIGIPKTIFVKNRADFLSKKTIGFPFPVVVKPSLSKIPVKNGFISTGVRFVGSQRELEELYANEEYLNYPSLIQERIQGDGTGLFTIFDGKEHRVLFSHKRLREKPPWGGVSVYSESVKIDGEMLDASKKLLSAIGWKGVAMVEFKRDNRDGRAKLMEINGRFWGSLELSVASGVDFPKLYIDFLLGKRLDITKNYSKGKRVKWILGDLDNHLIRWKTSKESLGGLFKEFIKLKEGNTVFDVLKITDIKPFLLELTEYTYNIFFQR